MISDPQNLLDMQVVLRDGKVIWASEQSSLMWALRGGGGKFGGECDCSPGLAPAGVDNTCQS